MKLTIFICISHQTHSVCENFSTETPSNLAHRAQPQDVRHAVESQLEPSTQPQATNVGTEVERHVARDVHEQNQPDYPRIYRGIVFLSQRGLFRQCSSPHLRSEFAYIIEVTVSCRTMYQINTVLTGRKPSKRVPQFPPWPRHRQGLHGARITA
ncbi:hypothetical protein SCHPADRAFT_722895 [Schizopora paradoxa]|uniref:Uncharacterized protein n=1 Tax=Schizopora paradoxa TaxID=27342 RepID=A0A0H2R2D6_9AGAM|nr:hypothetical protein SCHPADRAFT_722895 [Schizopora paradoxa]